jgi:bacterioferritin-associated ferredoxin
MTDRIFVCRCEDVTITELEHAFAAGLTTLEEIKRYTGFGTGPCQGKECLVAVAAALVERGLAEPEALVPFTARAPTEPVSFGALATVPDPFADPVPLPDIPDPGPGPDPEDPA